MTKSIQFLQIVALPNPLYALFPFHWTSKDVYRADIESWKWVIKKRIEPPLQGRMAKTLEELGATTETYDNIKGLAYGGTEVAGNDVDPVSSMAVRHFKSGSLKMFHFVGNAPGRFNQCPARLSLGMARSHSSALPRPLCLLPGRPCGHPVQVRQWILYPRIATVP
jgi:hypothetical protein